MFRLSAICVATLLLAPAAFAQDTPRVDTVAQAPTLDAAARAQVIDALVRHLNDYYVFPDVAAKIEVALRDKQKRGAYDGLVRRQDFAEALTADVRAAGNDLHLGVRASDTPMAPEPARDKTGPAPDEARMLARMKELNYGLGGIEKLPGNIGYLEVRGFVPVKHAEQALTAAMTQLADCDALIVDLRRNGGGDPAGVAFLTSYLFDQRTHLNDLHWREGNRTEEFWTRADVPGKKFGQQKPVYVLTSSKTFSGGEEFSNNLKVLQRATLVGETTGGGANPGRGHQLTPYFSAFIPNGRAINPITKTSWEHTGVAPDVKVAASDALAVAQKMALEKLAAAASDPQHAKSLRATAAALGSPVRADSQVIKVAPAVLDGYIGRYQVSPKMIIDITRDGDRLYGQAQGQPVMELFAKSDTEFFVREVDAQVRFNKADDGSPQLVLIQNGRNMPGKKLN
ncbi:S41 family peptidase [Massilia sp. R2A-15]|uniref:S41 family peptidase n=1 Tax=Massilia sp. R2A-15 TaxID=3064278 RepID=UPI0027363AD0|nr:S41 family peptidase [Massilia sp. R2A-15]WLI89023.1 S41 family peptidase [Massilia sp. R2A-15]